MISVYIFCEYGISLSTIKKLEQKDIEFLDILIDGENCLKEIWSGNSKRAKELIILAKLINEKEPLHKHSVFELTKYGLSDSVCKQLFELNIKIDQIERKNLLNANIKPNTINKIISSHQEWLQNNGHKTIDSNARLLKKILYLIANNKAIEIEDLKKYLITNTDYNLNYLNENIDYLVKEKKIIVNGTKIEYLLLSIDEALKRYTKDKEYEILDKRLDGLTLDELSIPLNLSRERVRQIANNALNRLPKLFEDRYQIMYEKYYWDEVTFCDFFEVNKRVFNYLKFKYTIGKESIVDFLANPLLTDHQRIVIETRSGYISIFDRIIKIDSNELLKLIIEEYAKDPIRIEEITDIYNNLLKTKLIEHHLPMFDHKAVEGHASRFNMTVFGFGRSIRYYEWEKINSHNKERLINLLNLEDGFYSSRLPFLNNLKLMKELDIRNEYELHYILRTICNDGTITFLRMPNILIGYDNKEDFLTKKIEELYPITVNDFVAVLDSNYGHKIKTMTAYITTAFRDNIRNGAFAINFTPLNEKEIALLKKHLTDDVYSFSQMRVLGKELDIGVSNKLLCTSNLQKLGYKSRSSYIIKEHINSIDQYIASKILSQDYYNCDQFEQIKKITVESVLYRLEKNLEIAKIAPKKYITSKKMTELGITESILKNLCAQIEEVAKTKDFFSLSIVKKKTTINKLNKYQLGDIFYKSIIASNYKIKTIRINNDKIFYLNDEVLTMEYFFKSIIGKEMKLSVLVAKLQSEYGLDINASKLKKALSKTSLPYDKKTKKVYSDMEKSHT